MYRIGVDIIEISHMEEILARSGDIFLDRAFTNAEKQAGRKHCFPAAYFAVTFAAKEAVFKLFGTGWDEGGDLKDIEVWQGPNGQPAVQLYGPFAQLTAKKQISLSLSCDADTATAVAVLF